MSILPSDDQRIADHNRRIFDLERQMVQIASAQAAHEKICGTRYEALEAKVDAGNKDTVELKAETKAQTETLVKIQIALGTQMGSKKTMLWLAQWLVLPSFAAIVTLIGALFSGIWAARAG